MIEQQCPQFLKRKRNDKQCHLATTKSLRWLGGRVFRPLRVTGRTTGLRGEDCSDTLTVWELLSGSLEQVVYRDSLSGGTSKGALVFGGLTAGLGMVRLSDRWVCSGMWMGSGLPLVHAGSLLFRRCLLFLLKIFPSSVLTSYDLTSTCCSTRALNHLPDLSVGFTRTISPFLRGEVPWHWCCSAWLAVVFSSRAFLGHSQLFWVWGVH